MAAQILRELGQAYRGDWSNVDGRTIRYELETIADLIENNSVITIEELRGKFGLCPMGHGHWTEHCNEYCMGG